MSPTEIEAFGVRGKLVWLEDEALRHDPTAERLAGAWRRLFNAEPPDEHAPTTPKNHEDWGDASAHRFGDRMIVSSYDGQSIWVPA
jgi:hypothetical protein